MKPNENEYLAKLNVTNDISGLFLLSQPKSELAFTFPILISVCGPFSSRVPYNIVYFLSHNSVLYIIRNLKMNQSSFLFDNLLTLKIENDENDTQH